MGRDLTPSLAEGRIVQALPQVLQTGRHFHILTPRGTRPRRVVRQFFDWLTAVAAQAATGETAG